MLKLIVKNFIFPNYTNNILNVASSLSNFLGNKTSHPTIKELDELLNKNYKNVVFLCFDGLGINPLNTNLTQKDFLNRNITKTLTSVFPSTTTNATTTLSSALSPSEHGMFAWCLYFEEINRVATLYLNYDHYTHEQLEPHFVHNRLLYTNYFDKANSDYEINLVIPQNISMSTNKEFRFKNTNEQFQYLNAICNKEGKQFIYSYSSTPDNIMHECGVNSPFSKQIIEEINYRVESFYKRNTNTLIVLTADHGQIDIDSWILIYKDETFNSFLTTPPFGEPRALMVNLKPNKEKEFINYINKTYEDVVIFKTQDLINKNIFGAEIKHNKLLGDYILTFNNNKQFVLGHLDKLHKGNHTGLTKEEMLVPLIMLESK